MKWDRKGKLFVSTVRSKFDRRYPNHFNGIISQEEFVRSNVCIRQKTCLLVSLCFSRFHSHIAIVIVRVKSDINGDNFARVPIYYRCLFRTSFLNDYITVCFAVPKNGTITTSNSWRIGKIFVEINALQLEIRNNDILYWKLWK